MPDACQYADGSRILTFRRSDKECIALTTHYKGVRFNQVELIFPSESTLRENPERDEIDSLFNVSGSGEDLVRHGFAVANWLTELPASGISYYRATPERGHIWRIERTRNGYRLQGARYVDSLTKLAVLSSAFNANTRFVTRPARERAAFARDTLY